MPIIKVKNILSAILILSFLSCHYVFAKDKLKFGLSFPPIKNSREMQFTIQEMKSLNISLIRFDTNWKLREPSKGNFNWAPLDRRINALISNNISILFTIIATAPDWACTDKTSYGTCVFNNDYAFRNYLHIFLKRYKNKIDKIQFANEWDNRKWYPGTPEDYVNFNNILYEEVKKISPKTKVVLGGLTKAYPLYMSKCIRKHPLSFENISLKPGIDLYKKVDRICTNQHLRSRVEYVLKNAKYDIVDLHLYDDAENWKFYVETITAITNKPILVSEFGGPSSQFEAYSEKYHANRMRKYINALETLPIIEVYHFNLVDNPQAYHSNSGLMTVYLNKKKRIIYLKA